MRRCYRIFGLGFALLGVELGASECRAQFGNGTNYPVLTYLGRYHGIGYSQGYHACNSGSCSPVSQLHRTASVPVAFARPVVPTTTPVTRDPWPDLGGSNWSQYQSMEQTSSLGYSLYASPDQGSSATAPPTSTFLTPEPTPISPMPNRSAPLASPSDANPRLRSPGNAEPLPAPKMSQPSAPTTSQRLYPAPTRFPFR